MKQIRTPRASWLPALLLSLGGLSATAQAQPPASPGPEQTGFLSCGPARFEVRTQYLDLPDHDRQVVAQKLERLGPDSTLPYRLPHEGRPLKQPFLKSMTVLDAWVSSWACLVSTNGQHHYLYLLYACTESPHRPACTGSEREWPRLLDLSGRPLNASFGRTGPRTPRLMQKLGLGRYLQEGVHLKDITDQDR